MFNLRKLSLSLLVSVSNIFWKWTNSPLVLKTAEFLTLNDNELCRLRIKVNYCILCLRTFCSVSVTLNS